MQLLNLGILAHVDAGKTSLTERLLYAAGVIDEIGSVDAGSTQTDFLALERQRGITIKSAVVSFVIADVTVNLIDTPGHPDFIAEVERVLGVLDGAVLVISAVEGVQAQTRVLLRALQRLRIPTLIFVNKIDRRGAQQESLLRSIAERLTPSIIALGSTSSLGTPAARYVPYEPTDDEFASRLLEHLAASNDELLAACIEQKATVSYPRLWSELVEQTAQVLIHPVFFGSAITGAGIDALIAGLRELLPRARGDLEGQRSGTIFKIERGPAGEKIAYVRMFAGSILSRDRLQVGGKFESRVTAIQVFERGAIVPRAAVRAGEIAKLWGLADAKIGDSVGSARASSASVQHFPPPTLETVVVPCRPADGAALHAALSQLAEQDPLINVRQDEARAVSVSLYGEVQKEVIQATLGSDFGIDVSFRETTTICIERPIQRGSAVEMVGKQPNPFAAGVGLCIEPAAIDSGVGFRLAVELGSMPVAFFKAIEETVQKTLQQGLHGWRVTDCLVTVTHSGFTPPVTTAADFRKLTPLVLMAALQQAGSHVCEPIHRFHVEIPADALQPVVLALGRSNATLQTTLAQKAAYVLDGEIPAANVHGLGQRLPGLTHGQGVLECVFDHYRPVRGAAPSRARTDHNPLNRKEYLLHVVRRVSGAS